MRDCCYEFSSWKVLVVDDEEDVISITKFALEGYSYFNRSLEFLSAKSAKEAIEIIDQHEDIAVVFLDIIMEHEQAGFDVIRYLRDVKNDYKIRIVIRTGEPGEHPETKVVSEYEINDYKSKGELTEESLNCTVTTALRSYCDLLMLEHYKNSEQVMIHKSKLMLFGEMMGMMLHQWQQPIAAIGLLSDIAKDDLRTFELSEEQHATMNDHCVKIKQQTEFLGSISRDFRQFFKTSKTKDDFSVREAIDKTLTIVADLVREKGVIIEVLVDQNASLYGDKNEFRHVILNLVKNSMDAYETGSREEKKIIFEYRDEEEVQILSVTDFAGGIHEDMLPDKIFEPYNTSKEEGSGIGLWMCRLILQNMGGVISASNENNGARFELLFGLNKEADS